MIHTIHGELTQLPVALILWSLSFLLRSFSIEYILQNIHPALQIERQQKQKTSTLFYIPRDTSKIRLKSLVIFLLFAKKWLNVQNGKKKKKAYKKTNTKECQLWMKEGKETQESHL